MQVEVMADVAAGGSTVHILVRLSAAVAKTAAGRPPVNLALVVDRSSSMRGPRLAQAISAATQLVDRLDPQDRLTVVTFDAAARVVFGPAPVTPEAKRELRAALADIHTGAGTNLAAGIKKGAESLRAVYLREGLSRLVLLTDGQPSVGVTDARKLGELAEREAKLGVTITGMGVGEGFDDELLADIARCGRGGFHYLASASDIPAAFGRELEGVFSIAATRAELKLVPSDDVTSIEVLHRLPSRPLDDGMLVEVGEVAAGAPRLVLLKLARRADAPSRHCGTLTFTYRRPDGSPGDAHIVGVDLSRSPMSEHLREVTRERLRLEVAAAVDGAWARRAGGEGPQALAVLAAVSRRIAEAEQRGRLDSRDGAELLDEIRAAREAVTKGAAEREKLRRGMRERSQITLLGQSVVQPLHPEED
jgi:Ca-activated chloride channel homolog